MVKLTTRNIREIRGKMMYGNMTIKELAEEYRVSESTIYRYTKGIRSTPLPTQKERCHA